MLSGSLTGLESHVRPVFSLSLFHPPATDVKKFSNGFVEYYRHQSLVLALRPSINYKTSSECRLFMPQIPYAHKIAFLYIDSRLADPLFHSIRDTQPIQWCPGN